jgi:hypothetical protein
MSAIHKHEMPGGEVFTASDGTRTVRVVLPTGTWRNSMVSEREWLAGYFGYQRTRGMY